MTALEILKRARKRIATKGLTKNQFESSKGAFCSLGAIRKTEDSMGYPPQCEAEFALFNALPAKWKKDNQFYSIVDYNDAKHRTKDQILALFDRAIVSLKASAPKISNRR